jgi:hypothetical protein
VRQLRQSGLGLALSALAALSACAQCGGAAGPPPERFVPADVTAAVVVPELRSAARSLAELYSTARGFPGTGGLPSLRASLSAQLGFDPLDLRALRDAGIDPRGGMAVALLRPASRGDAGRPAPLVVLPVSNRAAADALVRRIAVERLGAGERSVELVGPSQVAVYRERAGSQPALAVGNGDGYLILCSGPSGPAAVARALSLAQEASLAGSGAWKAAREATGRDAAAIGFLPPGSPALERLRMVRDGAALALSAEPHRLRARFVALLGDRDAGFQALAADGTGGALAARLDPASALVARFDGNPAALSAKVLPLLPPVGRAWPAAGVDLQRDLFGALAPGGAAAVSLAPRIDLATLDARSLSRDPLRLAQFELVVPVTDPARVAALSERIVRRALQRHRGGPFVLPTASGEVAWTLDGGRLLVAGGAPGRLAALRARLGEAAGGYRAPTDVARKALAAGGLAALVIDTQNFSASVRALSPEAFGTGPTGFVMRSLVNRFVDPAERLESAVLRAELVPGALLITLDVEPRAGEDRQP